MATAPGPVRGPTPGAVHAAVYNAVQQLRVAERAQSDAVHVLNAVVTALGELNRQQRLQNQRHAATATAAVDDNNDDALPLSPAVAAAQQRPQPRSRPISAPPARASPRPTYTAAGASTYVPSYARATSSSSAAAPASASPRRFESAPQHQYQQPPAQTPRPATPMRLRRWPEHELRSAAVGGGAASVAAATAAAPQTPVASVHAHAPSVPAHVKSRYAQSYYDPHTTARVSSRAFQPHMSPHNPLNDRPSAAQQCHIAVTALERDSTRLLRDWDAQFVTYKQHRAPPLSPSTHDALQQRCQLLAHTYLSDPALRARFGARIVRVSERVSAHAAADGTAQAAAARTAAAGRSVRPVAVLVDDKPFLQSKPFVVRKLPPKPAPQHYSD